MSLRADEKSLISWSGICKETSLIVVVITLLAGALGVDQVQNPANEAAGHGAKSIGPPVVVKLA